MRPVDERWATSQEFGGGATQGVDPYGSDPMAALVRQYGNYQPYGHAGKDIACPEGTPVYAMSGGTVLWADWGTKLPGDESDAGYRKRYYLYKKFPGIVTVIQHWWGKGVYAHLAEAWLNPGDRVTEGQQIGLSGGTGGVAPHLHVEALVDDTYTTGNGLIYGRTDPTPFFGGSAAIAPHGTITDSITDSEEDFMGGKIDAQQAEDIVQATAERVLAGILPLLDNKVRINAVQAESIVQATTTRTADAVDARANGKTIDKQQADDIAQAAANYSKDGK